MILSVTFSARLLTFLFFADDLAVFVGSLERLFGTLANVPEGAALGFPWQPSSLKSSLVAAKLLFAPVNMNGGGAVVGPVF